MGARAAFPFPLQPHAGHAAPRAATKHLRPYKSPFSTRVTASGTDVRHGLRRGELRGHRNRATGDNVVIWQKCEASRRATEFAAAKFFQTFVDTSGARRHVSRQTARHFFASSTRAGCRQYVVSVVPRASRAVRRGEPWFLLGDKAARERGGAAAHCSEPLEEVSAGQPRSRCRWPAPRRRASACGRTRLPARCGAAGMRRRAS
jgi:hypothetical protein